MDSNEDTGNIELGDLHLSWIYKLKKDQISAELGKFRLDLTGTVEEKKRRLIRFIREGYTSPLPPTAKFTRDFRTFCFPVNYLEDLEADISLRLQKPDEPATNYLTDLQTLVRRHGDLNPEQELRWLYRNLLPDYRQYIRRNDFTDVSSLSAKIKEFELLRQEVRQVYDGKEPIPRPNTSRRFENRSPEQYSVPPRQAESRPVVERPVPMPRNTRLPATPREEPPNSVRQQDRPTAPQTAPRTYRSPEPSENQPSTTAATYYRNSCWRCGRTGHFRNTTAVRPDNRPHVKVQMFGRTFSALVDTGAVRSYLGDRIKEVCDQLHIAADDVTVPTAQLANGRLATVTRAYRIDFLIGEDSFSECLFHLTNLSSDLVLGMDILSQYRFQINPSAGTMLLNDRPISEPLAAPSSPLGGISLTLSQPEEEQLA
ncbi:hypothetical protein NQ314_016853, partial [Rhamnusium bicolor]